MGYGSDADALVHFGECELLSIHLYFFLLHGQPSEVGTNALYTAFAFAASACQPSLPNIIPLGALFLATRFHLLAIYTTLASHANASNPKYGGVPL
eukprot:scaffold20521_cov114-Skeletonema_marinoi.AAC.3